MNGWDVRIEVSGRAESRNSDSQKAFTLPSE